MPVAELLAGKFVRLTAFTAKDLPALARWQQDSLFLRHFDSRPAFPRAEEELARWLEDEHKSSTAFLFAIRAQENDELLGYVEVDGIEWSHQVGWVGIGLGDRAQWGKGYGREAMELALQFAFAELNLHRLQLTVFSYNQRAIALYEKLGFQREGVFREFMQRDGQRFDMYLYGLLRREWQAR